LNVAMMTRAALMAAVTAVAAQIAIPLPFSPVPFTLQVLAVILSGLLLGPRYGALAQAIYLLIGAVGVPVFAQFRGGLGVLLGPTGGAARRRALWTSLLWGCAGLAVIYALGATWLALVTGLPIAAALAQGVAPFVLFDLIKVAIAALVAVAAAPAIAASRI
jgi:biotin transport system substrate-specific component